MLPEAANHSLINEEKYKWNYKGAIFGVFFLPVIPAKAGIQGCKIPLLRGGSPQD
jgi:hypothetical protein